MSNTRYLLINGNNQILAKNGEWLGLRDQKNFFHTEFKDEAINSCVELTVKYPELRIRVINATIIENELKFPEHVCIVEDIERPEPESATSCIAEAV